MRTTLAKPEVSTNYPGPEAPDELYREILSELPASDLELIELGIAALGHRIVDCTGDRIGTVASVLVDRETARPAWLAVHLPRTRRGAFVGIPMTGITSFAGIAWAPLEAQLVRSAPLVHGQHLSARIEQALCRHYGLPQSPGASGGRWERRASCARVAGRLPDGVLVWTPGPRERLDAALRSRAAA